MVSVNCEFDRIYSLGDMLFARYVKIILIMLIDEGRFSLTEDPSRGWDSRPYKMEKEAKP